jgi:hypothetical protein
LLCQILDQTFALYQDAQEVLAYTAIRIKEQYNRHHQPMYFKKGEKILL